MWDAVQARVARGGSEEAAVAELKLQRAGWSLNQLVDELKHRRQHQNARGAPVARGEGWARRFNLFGRRGGSSRQAVAT